MTSCPQLPPLPEPDGYVAMTHEGSFIVPPQEVRAHNCYAIFTAEQMRAFWKAGAAWQREQDAKLCEGVARHTTAIDGTAFYVATGQCAAAIRGQQDPTI